ncbi:MAG: hypothetical protein KAX19_03020, partial [Candidatus Brocadiae bacterium]|nr:hypothetical protein [Candidatus Brocadiia bacterium]
GDGVAYGTAPELERHYSVPMSVLQQLVACAREAGLAVVPKLNFSKSKEPSHDHNYWFRPYNELPDDDAYWTKAFQLIDEIIEGVKPGRHFFVGMDEDFLRTPAEYASAVTALHGGLSTRGLRTVMWNDTPHLSAGMFGCVEKALAAEDEAPGDIVHVVWDYTPLKARTAQRVQDMRSKGLEVWIAPGRRPDDVERWKQLALQTGCTGLVMTMWGPVTERNRRMFLDAIEQIGPIYTRADAVEGERVVGTPGPRALHVSKVEMSPAATMDEPVVAPNTLGEPVEDAPYLLPPNVYVCNWMVLGPMPYVPQDYAGRESQGVIDDDGFVGGVEAGLAAADPGAEAFGVTWQRYVPPAGTRFPQMIDLAGMYGGPDYALAYAAAHVYSEEDLTGCSVYLGSDDYVKVWLNGHLIHTWAERSRAIGQDDDKVEGIALRRGWNKLVVKCVNVKATWGFILRIADEGDRPLVTK